MKAEKKKLLPKNVGVPEGTQVKDLTLEKRIELFNISFKDFLDESGKVYGLSLGAEIVWSKRAAIPRIVIVNLLEDKDDKENKATK